MRHQSTYDFAEICRQHGVIRAVLCPGSRSAPLALAMANHPAIRTLVIPDERSAGFIALGMAQALQKPVILICTSGTAALEFAPAVAEAYYLHVPLLICTADRPAEWINQRDGQTIQQENLYGGHVKRFFSIPTDDTPDSIWSANRQMNEAIGVSQEYPMGPVHLNFPFREPLYPAAKEKITFGKPRIIRQEPAQHSLGSDAARRLHKELGAFRRILVVGGPLSEPTPLKLAAGCPLPLLAEIVANLHHLSQAIAHADLLFTTASEKTRQDLRPDLLITFGNGVISRQTRQYLRAFPAKETWHIQEAGIVADTFQNLTRVIRTTPGAFFQWASRVKYHKSQADYFNRWRDAGRMIRQRALKILGNSTGEAGLVNEIITRLPAGSTLHLANSMSVRYAMMTGLKTSQRSVRVFSNRGTSGIDGCSSTAVGHAIVHSGLHILITGDVAFFYDRNAFWHKYRIPNLRIVLLNNGGGQIFGLIDGPKDRPERDEYFVGTQQLRADSICREYGFHHTALTPDDANRDETVTSFLRPGKQTRVLEFIGTPEEDKEFLKLLHQQLKEDHGQQS